MPFADLVLLPVLLAVAAALWLAHADAWDLAGNSPLLDAESAPYAVAARRLAQSGRLETRFAWPIELTKHGAPPWPIGALQPGPVLVQGALFRVVPADRVLSGSDQRAALALLLPFGCFLFLAGSLALCVRHLFARWHPGASTLERVAVGAAVALAFALDPEAQHRAMGAFTDLPFATGLMFALLGLALGVAAEIPFVYGVVLGAAGLFRADMMWLAPVFALGAAWMAADGARTHDHRPAAARAFSTFLFVSVGFLLVLAPWWAFKAREFGNPLWDPTRLVLWEGVGGRSAFAMMHVAEDPALPGGAVAAGLLARKALSALPEMLLGLLTGPRAMWLAAIALWLGLARPPRPLAAAGLVTLAIALLTALGSALGGAWVRELFAVRVLAEAAGLLAVLALVHRYTGDADQQRLRRLLQGGAIVLALGWGAWQTTRGNTHARAASSQRRVPTTRALQEVNMAFVRDSLGRSEAVFSNVGAILAWTTNQPVVDLPLTPEDVPACRERHDVRHVLLGMRPGDASWPAWSDVFEREGAASGTPGLHATNERRWTSRDGFQWVWLELPPRAPAVAAAETRAIAAR